LFQSVDIIRQAFGKMQPGDIEVKVTGNPTAKPSPAPSSRAAKWFTI
jgi:hypothetical protein